MKRCYTNNSYFDSSMFFYLNCWQYYHLLDARSHLSSIHKYKCSVGVFQRALGGLVSVKNTLRKDFGLDHLATLIHITQRAMKAYVFFLSNVAEL